MFEIEHADNGDVLCRGRLDAAQCEKAQGFMDGLEGANTLDFAGLEYISSAGLGVLVATYRRLSETGENLTLRHLNQSVRNIFRFSGLDRLFKIE